MNELDSVDDVTEIATSTLTDMLTGFISHIPYLIGAIAVLLLTWGLAALVERFVPRIVGRWKQRESLKQLYVRLISIGVWVFGLMLVAVILFPGVTPSKVLGGLGIASLAVGLAFKDIFENFFAGILLLLRFPFENGDHIECEGIVGKVEKVLFRMTYVRKTSGELVVVPNSFLFKNPVQVLTERPIRRVTVMTGVSYDTAVHEALPILEQAIRGCETVEEDKPVQVFAQAYGSSSIDIELTWWTASTPFDVRKSRSEVVVATKRALDDAGIEIPFPYRTLTFKEPLTVGNMDQQSS